VKTNCINCGAALKPKAPTCMYCQTPQPEVLSSSSSGVKSKYVIDERYEYTSAGYLIDITTASDKGNRRTIPAAPPTNKGR